MSQEIHADIAIIGGGVGGVSAALAALQAGRSVVMTESTAWLGGQLTSQLVPSDEHHFIEDTGANRSYRHFRTVLRDFYRNHFPLTPEAAADQHLNPGAGWVTPLSVDPRVIVAVIDDMLLPYRMNGQLTVLMGVEPVAASTDGDIITSVTVRGVHDGGETIVTGVYFLDATELGDLLELGGVEHVSGREARDQTGEPNAALTADPTDMQSVTWCFAVDHIDGGDFTIDKPASYERHVAWSPAHRHGLPVLDFRANVNPDGTARRTWRLDVNADDDPFAIDLDHRHMGPAPDLWTYRRIAARRQFREGYIPSDITIVNWPMNDYVGGPLFGVADAAEHWRESKELAKSLLYWLQTEAPRPDGGTGWPGLRLRPDVAGTQDGFAMMPYIRESRRILALRTIVEQDVSATIRGDRGAEHYPDTVGTGHYYWIDRHPSTRGTLWLGDIPHPFEIPLSALIPRRVRNLLPACKNIGTTQITNGCYRLHPVEWSIGEAAGALVAYCLAERTEPHAVAGEPARLAAFQHHLEGRGVQLRWPEGMLWAAGPDAEHFEEVRK
ncbi:FAD-dependent oxidoreductase [Microbacterium sp. SLBN-146]|uniref:FAD-dependent oxidoreductase n=1 Tax=Microbacterium sp. SLBN-146 TaxID=2768457 RepID=UPI00114F5A34|nr:FAD-dependent oxidoreductase [Microbacterium sp. SLBN-146]TQJ30444.1 FAD dependent oxidoreductase [Microbacterium sp. SLBN-146]